jgi:hypothetical protein
MTLRYAAAGAALVSNAYSQGAKGNIMTRPTAARAKNTTPPPLRAAAASPAPNPNRGALDILSDADGRTTTCDDVCAFT